MSLTPVTLDDLSWRGMLDAIRRRIPAASGGAWTLHSPVDPGVTLLELYAWLLEQRVFWLDQTPDELVHAAARLLGVHAGSTRAARTVLELSLAQPAAAGWAEVTRRTRFGVVDAEPAIVFTTLGHTLALDLERVDPADPSSPWRTAASTRSTGEERELSPGGPLELFACDGRAAEARFDFTLRSAAPANPRRAFKVLLDLDTSPAIAAGWHPSEARLAPPPAELRWWYSSAQGRTEFGADQLRDGTLGFRRAGVLELRPPDWRPWRPAPNAPLVYSVWAAVESCRFAYRPRLRALVPNVVVAEHRCRVRPPAFALDWPPLPARELSLARPPRSFDGDGPFERGVELALRERDGRWHTWTAARDLVRARAADRVFAVDRLRQRLVCGDGYNGRIPALAGATGPGEVNARWTAWMGGGPRGNLASGLAWEPSSGSSDTFAAVRNVVAAVGGAAAETVPELRARCAAVRAEVTRAVTKDDYEELARTTPGVDVARAWAALGVHPRQACPVASAVTVFIVPWAPREKGLPEESLVRAPVADEGMLRAVRARLRRRRIVGSEVFVRPARYRTVALTVTLAGSVHDPAELRTRLERQLRSFLDPLPVDDPQGGWPFGAPLRPSALVREAQLAAGAKLEVLRVGVTLNGDTAIEECSDVPIGANALVELVSLALRFEPAREPAGGLR